MLKTETPARVSSVHFARFAWAVLAYNLPVILWGAFVRASGSGAGCGNHWPLCGGQLSPTFETLAKVIEFLHRATSGFDGILVVAMVVWAFRAFPSGHPARLGATLSLVFVLTEGALGASLVLLEHVAKDQSAARASWDAGHLINTLTLLACIALTAWWGSGKPAVRLHSRAVGVAAASLLAVMLLGVTGVIAALADTLFPASSLSAGLAQDFDPAANLFLRLRGLHPILAAGVGAWLFVFAAGSLRAMATRRMALAVIALVSAQLIAGLLNTLLLAPVGLQMLHLLLADLVWIALVLLCASMLAEP
ncbi:Cytochrome oxidase assembly [Candidatus Sulfopaludibacter sp. SbA3]|nr:Cytochrome oxidase assembly [Candidatus Sulfopaludibacter sp. SbA3]